MNTILFTAAASNAFLTIFYLEKLPSVPILTVRTLMHLII